MTGIGGGGVRERRMGRGTRWRCRIREPDEKEMGGASDLMGQVDLRPVSRERKSRDGGGGAVCLGQRRRAGKTLFRGGGRVGGCLGVWLNILFP